MLPAGVNGPFTASSTMPAATVGAVVADAVGPVVTARSSLTADGLAEEVVVIGHDIGGLGSPDTVVRPRRGGVRARSCSTSPSTSMSATTVNLAGDPFTVVGTTRDTTLLAGMPLVFMTTTDAQDLVFRSRDVISAVLVDGEVTSVPEGMELMTIDDIAPDTLRPLDGAIASIDLVRFLLWIVAAVIIGSVVYLSALERQRDFAVLKAIGTSNRTLLASLALQAVLVAALAVPSPCRGHPDLPRARVPAEGDGARPRLLAVAAARGGRWPCSPELVGHASGGPLRPGRSRSPEPADERTPGSGSRRRVRPRRLRRAAARRPVVRRPGR